MSENTTPKAGFVAEISAFAHKDVTDPATWRDFIQVLDQILGNNRRDSVAVRRGAQTGDIKFSLQRIDTDLPIGQQMPGYVPWLPNLELHKDQYPALYEKIGDANPNAGSDDETFVLPDHMNGFVRIAAIPDIPGNTAKTLDTGGAFDEIVVSAWIKT